MLECFKQFSNNDLHLELYLIVIRLSIQVLKVLSLVGILLHVNLNVLENANLQTALFTIHYSIWAQVFTRDKTMDVEWMYIPNCDKPYYPSVD